MPIIVSWTDFPYIFPTFAYLVPEEKRGRSDFYLHLALAQRREVIQ